MRISANSWIGSKEWWRIRIMVMFLSLVFFCSYTPSTRGSSLSDGMRSSDHGDKSTLHGSHDSDSDGDDDDDSGDSFSDWLFGSIIKGLFSCLFHHEHEDHVSQS